MNLFFTLSYIQLSTGIITFIVGILGGKFFKEDNIVNFFNKVKNQGILNIILGIISVILQYLNSDLFIISMILFVIGILFSFIYILINLILLIQKSNIGKLTKVITIICLVLASIYMFFADSINNTLRIGFRNFQDPITIGKEFLLYECDDISHGNEKIYMTINNIEKDNGSYVDDDEFSCTIMDFDLRYEGNKPIKLIDENISFSDLSSFRTTISSNKLKKDNHIADFIIEDDMNSDVIHSEYTNTLPKLIKPGMTLKNLTHKVAVMGVGYDQLPIKDLDIEIETGFKIQHSGKNIRENINK